MVSSTPSWRVKMTEQRTLKKQGAALLYKRVKLLAAIADDAEFISECTANGDNWEDVLDNEVGDTATNFFVLRAVFVEYPNEADWQKHGVEHLIASVSAKQAKDKGERNTPTWKEKAKAAQLEIERLQRQLDAANARVNELERVVEMLARGSRMEAEKQVA